MAAGGNHFAQPAAAREPAAPRYSSEAPRPSPGAALRARPAGRMRSPAIRNSRGALSPAAGNTGGGPQKQRTGTCAEGLSGHSQSFGRVLTIVAGDCALLERDGKLALLSLPVAERWLRQAQLTPEVEPVCAQPLLILRG